MHYGADDSADFGTLQAMNAKNSTDDQHISALKTEIGQRLKLERERLGLKAADFSSFGNWPARTIYGWESGLATPKAEFFASVQELGLDIPFIITGHRTASSGAAASAKASMLSTSASPKRQLTGPSPAPRSLDDTLYIPLLSATGSMGPGAEALAADVVMGDVPVSLTWVQMNLPRSRPEALRLVHAYGDSMRGTLESGDFALVDTDIHSVDIDGVYVLEAHQRLFIKRVRQRMDGAYEISSDNPAIKQIDILNGGHEVRVCGMVVYGWNGRRF